MASTTKKDRLRKGRYEPFKTCHTQQKHEQWIIVNGLEHVRYVLAKSSTTTPPLLKYSIRPLFMGMGLVKLHDHSCEKISPCFMTKFPQIPGVYQGTA